MRSRSHARFTRQRVETACNSADMQGGAFLVTFGRVRPRQLAEILAAATPVSSVSVPSEDKQTPELVRTSEGQNSSSDDMAGEWRRSGRGSDRTRPAGRLALIFAPRPGPGVTRHVSHRPTGPLHEQGCHGGLSSAPSLHFMV
jgi:hypothetical protein